MRAEIHYQIQNLSANQADFETILAAMGEYENVLHPREEATVELVQVNDSVLMALSKAIGNRRYEREYLRDIETMRAEFESHFNSEDTVRLSGRFAGLKMPQGLEVE